MDTHIMWPQADAKEIEQKLWDEYSSENVRKHLNYLTTLTRRAGTEDELKAAQYIKGKIDEYGIEGDIYEFDAYIGEPGKSELHILSPIQKVIPSFSRIHIAPTPPVGIEAELVSLSRKSADEVKQIDIRGKIVLIEGDRLSRRYVAPMAQKMGAVAQIHITRAKHGAINMGGVRVTWGSPTPETLKDVSGPSAIAISNEDGKYLDELTQKGPVVVRLKADAWQGYKRIRVPVGNIRGVKEPDKFVLIAGHYCSWFAGASDNAAADALILEMARVFAKHRDLLGRGIRFAWWSGHEQGPYSGSTWYAENFWDDMRDNAIAYFALDGIARVGSSGFESRNTVEFRIFLEKVVKDVLGLDMNSKSLPKSGDMSFTGIGLPAAMQRTTFKKNQTDRDGFGPTWFSHTVEDTLDKVDMELLEAPFKVHVASILRLCNQPILPFDFCSVAEILMTRLKELQAMNKSDVTLSAVMSQADIFSANTQTLNLNIKKALAEYEEKDCRPDSEKAFKRFNACLMGLCRILLPVITTKSDKYNHDPMGSSFKPIPLLEPLNELSSMESQTDEYKALQTALFRARNQVSDAIKAANDLLSSTLKSLPYNFTEQ